MRVARATLSEGVCQIHLYQICTQVATDALMISSWWIRKHPQQKPSDAPHKLGSNADGRAKMPSDRLQNQFQNDKCKIGRAHV